MLALRSQFDGKQIVTPQELRGQKPCDLIIVRLDHEDQVNRAAWQNLQQEALGEVWNNDEDAVYDNL